MATFNFELTSPEKNLFSGEVEQVDVPGIEGDFGVLSGHAPFITLLRPGILVVRNGSEEQRIVVFGGFAEVNPDGLTVLADVATAVEDLDRALLAKKIEEQEQEVRRLEGEGSALDKAITRLDHYKQVQDHIESTGMH